MGGKDLRWWAALGLLALLLSAPRTALGGPYLGEWSWCWKPSGDCTPSLYSPCHYWTPTAYRLRAWCKPSSKDSYAPGVPIHPTFIVQGYPCQSTAPAPSPPYADPEAYYGIPIVPPPQGQAMGQGTTPRFDPYP
jgi:hypothetical protein